MSKILSVADALDILQQNPPASIEKFQSGAQVNAEIYRLQAALGIAPGNPVFNTRSGRAKILILQSQLDAKVASQPKSAPVTVPAVPAAAAPAAVVPPV